MKEEMQEKEVIDYQQFISGIILNLQTVDVVDFNLILDDFKKKENVIVKRKWYNTQLNLGLYIERTDDGMFKLNEGMFLDFFITEENRSLKEKLTAIAGDKVNNYFSNFDYEKYKQEKEKLLDNNKKWALDSANILLITDIQEDYDGIKKCGYKNVDYFKSIVRADKYFAKHPEELKKYHFLIRGRQNVDCCCLKGAFELENEIRKLKISHHIYEFPLRLGEDLTTYLYDYHYYNNHGYTVTEQTHDGIMDRILENALINNAIDKTITPERKYTPIQDYINPNRLPLPTKKSDLKILYLDAVCVNDYAKDLAKKLGLNINFMEDNNSTLWEIKSSLGDYDIIIGSHYSNALKDMNVESTEQCKDTGRDLSLLVLYDTNHYWQTYIDGESNYEDYDNEIELKYRYAGNYAVNSLLNKKAFKCLSEQPLFLSEEYYEIKSVAEMYAIIGASVNLYNEALLKNNKAPIKDLDIKNVEEFDNEYEIVFNNKNEQIKMDIETINIFDGVRDIVKDYLKYKKKGLIKKEFENLKITESDNCITVKRCYKGEFVCAIKYLKKYEEKNLRIFDMQIAAKKERVGLYSSKFEKVKEIPNRLNQEQRKELEKLFIIINTKLSRANYKARCRKRKKGTAKKLVLKKEPK